MKYRVVFVDQNDVPIERNTATAIFDDKRAADEWAMAQVLGNILRCEGYWIEKVSDAKPASKVP